ncbi:hypothetical protein JCM4814A_73700 [Streptomyces phaeofaciens JCM 4814]|uniref:Uncharacterized protein n=1 Tax=Streptomyces phaeofaciens TaxID=68254 RepID=A0A918HJB2_9ACTN|nr:hypothetical protein [Streptomyces phaeofaciens]GGT63057.1 hypothetical protein GCM10010226_46160 [Streptomyces phaeofaciens]
MLLDPVTHHVAPVLLSGADEVVAEAFEESACQGRPGSGGGFDIVGADAYGDAGDDFRQGLREYLKHGKPIAATEFGCCTYRGAAARGGIGWWGVVDHDADPPRLDGDYLRDEDEQARYLRRQLDVFTEEGVDTAFVRARSGGVGVGVGRRRQTSLTDLTVLEVHNDGDPGGKHPRHYEV